MSAGHLDTTAPQSLDTLLMAFLINNLGEELATEDIATKWDVPQRGVHTRLADALNAGKLTRRRDGDGTWYYAAGPNLGVLRDAAAKPAERTTEPKMPDLATLQLLDDVPMPQGRNGVLLLDSLALLDRMQPGQATPLLPASIKPTMGKAITQKHKTGNAVFAMRRIGPNHVRVWRTA
jgi:hypothetical protein